MPLYEYECNTCGHRFELIRKFSDPPVRECVTCGGPVRKLISPPAIQFKGTGWYVTDYARKPGAGQPAEKPPGESPPDKSKSGQSADKQPASAESSKSSPAKPAPKSGAAATSNR